MPIATTTVHHHPTGTSAPALTDVPLAVTGVVYGTVAQPHGVRGPVRASDVDRGTYVAPRGTVDVSGPDAGPWWAELTPDDPRDPIHTCSSDPATIALITLGWLDTLGATVTERA